MKIIKYKKNENPFQLKTGQIRGRIDDIKLTFMCLRQKRTKIAFTLHAKPIVNKFLEFSVVSLFFNLIWKGVPNMRTQTS